MILNNGSPVFTHSGSNLASFNSGNPYCSGSAYGAVSLSLMNHTGQGSVSLYLSPDPTGATYNLGPTYVLDCTMNPPLSWIAWLPTDTTGAGPLYAFAQCTPSPGGRSCGLNTCGCAWQRSPPARTQFAR